MKYLKTKFAKFHYNAIFPRMIGKLNNSINNKPKSIQLKKVNQKIVILKILLMKIKKWRKKVIKRRNQKEKKVKKGQKSEKNFK